MSSDEKLRADAQANRERILNVARVALTADPLVSLNAIAKLAGVGAGTLYRHFPSREALVLGVYRQEIDALAELAPRLLAAHPPLRAFRLWCGELAAFGRMKYGMADIVHAAASDQKLPDTYTLMLGAVRQLMEACKGASEIRPGADAEDFLMLLGLLSRIPPDAEGAARVQRLLDLAIRGLGAGEMTTPEAASRESSGVAAKYLR